VLKHPLRHTSLYISGPGGDGRALHRGIHPIQNRGAWDPGGPGRGPLGAQKGARNYVRAQRNVHKCQRKKRKPKKKERKKKRKKNANENLNCEAVFLIF
jgi:hypothetical protein